MKKVIKIFVISFIIFISCNAVSQNEKIDAITKNSLDSFIKSSLTVKQMFTNSTIIDNFMDAVLEMETLFEFMPEQRKYITLDDVRYIADYFVTNYYVKGAKSVDEAKQYIIDRDKEMGIEVYKNIDDVGYHAFDEDLFKTEEDRLKEIEKKYFN